ncbi:hypothetical protein B0H11DRAFT_1980187 [Mycena galericulata]|nr:hypothetical protein B0H11DRAFT_1980187 [Mycena galericulata]
MSGYEKPRLRLSSTTRSSQHLSFLFRLFLTLCTSIILGCVVTHFLPTTNAFELSYSLSYFSAFFSIYLTILAQFYAPVHIKMTDFFSLGHRVYNRSHISHMRIDRFRRLPGYSQPSLEPFWALHFFSWAWNWLSVTVVSPQQFSPLNIQIIILRLGHNTCVDSASEGGSGNIRSNDACYPGKHPDNLNGGFQGNLKLHQTRNFSPDHSGVVSDDEDNHPSLSHGPSSRPRVGSTSDDYSSEHVKYCLSISYGAPSRLRGGQTSDDDSSSAAESDAPKRKRKGASILKPRKRPSSSRSKGKAKATDTGSDSEQGIRVTAKSKKRRTGGMFVDEIIHLTAALESYDVPASTHRVAFILDLSDTPELLSAGRKLLTVDGFIKKECQDSFSGPTGSTSERSLAKVIILNEDSDEPVLCRRSTLTCSGCYKCSLAANDFLESCSRWDNSDETEGTVFAPVLAAKALEASSVAATASAFYRSVIGTFCKGQFIDSEIPCGGRAILRKFSQGKMDGKTYFVGCGNWTHGDSDQMSKIHRFTKIPSAVRESILLKLFKGEAIDNDDNDTEVLAGSCSQIIHPSHLPRNSLCPRSHFQDGVHVVAKLQKHACNAQLSILVPIDTGDLRAVIIPAAGVPHSHPQFARTKIPSEIKRKYQECIDAAGVIGTTTLRVDKASSTHAILGGKLPQELHPGLLIQRKQTLFPDGTGLSAIYSEFDKDRSRDIEDRYIHGVATRADGTHVIITINPTLAALALEAIWIMVDTTFAVVHGKTNEWKLIIWLNSVDKRTVIGRVWSNRATREAFVLVWNGIFDAIETITGKKLNLKIFSDKSKLLGIIGDSEGAQAQGLGDVIILRRMNLLTANGIATVDIDSILIVIWKTCIVHFNRGVFALKAYISENDLAYLLSFPYLSSEAEIQEYYTFCAESANTKIQSWWAHKLSYPWLLPSLNRELSGMDKRHWDLTPRDTNPIEGSHVQDNQVNSTRRSLLEAILLAKKLDADTARLIMAMLTSGVLENPNNSLQARFKNQSQRQARNREKQRELESESLTRGEAKKLRNEVKAEKERAKTQQMEIANLQKRINALTRGGASCPSSPPQQPVASSSRINQHSTPDNCIDVDAMFNSPPMRSMELFPSSHSPSLSVNSLSDFDYQAALNSDIMSPTLKRIVKDHPMYGVDSDDEVLASDPYPVG